MTVNTVRNTVRKHISMCLEEERENGITSTYCTFPYKDYKEKINLTLMYGMQLGFSEGGSCWEYLGPAAEGQKLHSMLGQRT